MSIITKNSEVYIGGAGWLQRASLASRSFSSDTTVADVAEEIWGQEYVDMLPNTNEGSIALPTVHRGPVADEISAHRKDDINYVFLTLSERFGYGGQVIIPQFNASGSSGALLSRDVTFMQAGSRDWVNCGIAKQFALSAATTSVNTPASNSAVENRAFLIVTAKSAGSITVRITQGSTNVDTVVTAPGVSRLDISGFTGSTAITITTQPAVTGNTTVSGVLLVGRECGTDG